MKKLNLFDEVNANKFNSYLLVILSFFILIATGWAFSYIFRFGNFGFYLSIVLTVGYIILMYFKGQKYILDMAGAAPVERKKYPYLYDIVEGMAIANHIPTPKIYITPDDSPNAFAVGNDPEHSAIAVTRGLLRRLNNEELEAVVAHEVSHIANYDTRFVLYAVVMVGAISILSQITLRFFAYSSGNDRKGGGFLGVLALILMILAPIFILFVRFAISRQREYLADVHGAKTTRNPEGLALALEKIKKYDAPVANATEATAPLYFTNPFAGKMSFMFSTHPPIDERIKRLRAL